VADFCKAVLPVSSGCGHGLSALQDWLKRDFWSALTGLADAHTAGVFFTVVLPVEGLLSSMRCSGGLHTRHQTMGHA
jgi:hypothetical protein